MLLFLLLLSSSASTSLLQAANEALMMLRDVSTHARRHPKGPPRRSQRHLKAPQGTFGKMGRPPSPHILSRIIGLDRIGLDWIGSTVTIVASTNIFIIVVKRGSSVDDDEP